MAKLRKRVKKKTTKASSGKNSVARAWRKIYLCRSEGHPVYRADTIFGQRALSMALTNAKSKKVVDIGGGKGPFTSRLKKSNAEATIVDFSGTKLFPHSIKAEGFKGKAEKLPKEWTGKFGVVLLSYSLSYTDKKKQFRRQKEFWKKAEGLLHCYTTQTQFM